ncbi:MAG: TerB family tellurite resistance protein [Acidobacteriota bacterium]|nr:TerB family tellurite resistance protein [Acidobacteriota bacterium]
MRAALRNLLGLADEDVTATERTPLRDLVDSLDGLEPARAQHLARFAYLLGRVARADQQVSAAETRTMESLLIEHGRLSPAQAVLVVGLAKSSSLLFGGTADFEVARDFAASATDDEKVALARCLYAVAASDQRISMAEETEVHRIANLLYLEPKTLTAIRLQYRPFLPGVSGTKPSEQ